MSDADFQQQPLDQASLAKGDAVQQFPTSADVLNKPGDVAAVQGTILPPKEYAAAVDSLQNTKPSEVWSSPQTYEHFHRNLNNVVATAIDSGDTARMTQVQDALQAHIGQTTKFVTGDRPALISELEQKISQDLSTNQNA